MINLENYTVNSKLVLTPKNRAAVRTILEVNTVAGKEMLFATVRLYRSLNPGKRVMIRYRLGKNNAFASSYSINVKRYPGNVHAAHGQYADIYIYSR